MLTTRLSLRVLAGAIEQSARVRFTMSKVNGSKVNSKVSKSKGKGKGTASKQAVSPAMKAFSPLSREFGSAYRALNMSADTLGRLYGSMLKTGLAAAKIARLLKDEHGRFMLSSKYAITKTNLESWLAIHEKFGKFGGVRSGSHYVSPEDMQTLGLNPETHAALVESIVRPVDTVHVADVERIVKQVSAGTLKPDAIKPMVTTLVESGSAKVRESRKAEAAKTVKSLTAKEQQAARDSAIKSKRAELERATKTLAAAQARVNELTAELAALESRKPSARKSRKAGKVTASISA